MVAQHIIDQVRGDGHLSSRLLLPRKAPFDQAGDGGDIAEGPLHQNGFVQPGIQIVPQHVRRQQRVHVRHRAQRPYRHRIVAGDETQRTQAQPFHPPGQQHAERLVRQPPLERVGDQIVLPGAREHFHEQFVRTRQDGAPALQAQPVTGLRRQARMLPRIGQDRAHLVGQEGGERELAALIAGDAGFRPRRAHDDGGGFLHRLEAHDLAREDEGVTGTELLDEILLDLAQVPPAPQPHLQHRRLDDGADIHAVLLRHARVGHAPEPLHCLPQPVIALVAFQRIAAGGDEIDHPVEGLPVQRAIGLGRGDFRKQVVGIEGRATGDPQHMLRQHIQRTVTGGRRIHLPLCQSLKRRQALQFLEPVGRGEHGLAGFVEAMIRATDALQCTGRALRRADLDHQVHVAPVDAEVQRGGTDHGPERPARHGRLHLAPAFHVQAAMMQRDGQHVVIHPPEFLKHQLRLAAGIDEDQHGAMVPDRLIDLRYDMPCRVPGPRDPPLRPQDRHLRLRTRGTTDDGGRFLSQPDESRQPFRFSHRRRKPDTPVTGRDRLKPGEIQRQQIPAPCIGKGMQLVDDDGPEVLKHLPRLPRRKQQRELFRRGQQHVRRCLLLPLTLRLRRVPGACFKRHRQCHFPDRRIEILRDVVGQRLER